MWKETIRLWRGQNIQYTMHYLCHMKSTDSLTPPPQSLLFQRPLADSQPHSHNFGNFLRRLAFALVSTFLYAIYWKAKVYLISVGDRKIVVRSVRKNQHILYRTHGIYISVHCSFCFVLCLAGVTNLIFSQPLSPLHSNSIWEKCVNEHILCSRAKLVISTRMSFLFCT
jgi:hypothetical protein